MRIPPFVLALAAVLGTVGGGSLECTPPREAFLQHHGAELYGRMCAVCHGLSGEGYRADQAPAIGHSDYLATASDIYLHHTIDDGRAGTTMSAWGLDHGGPLRTHDVDAVIAFLRTWQSEAPAALDERPAIGDPKKGLIVYTRECARCHGTRGTGGEYLAIGGAQLLENATNGFLRRAIQRGRHGTAMPAFEGTLDSGAIEDVVALLRDWQRTGPPVAFQRAAPARPPPIPLGPAPLNPKGPDPTDFLAQPKTTKADVIKHELDRGAKLALLDARAPSDYMREHIAGAVSVPFYDPDQYYPQLPKDAWLVCYCSCPHAESGQLASKLVANGFKKVTVLDEGLGYWTRHGYPTHTGLDP
ncbi:MAG TPA: c-type cytochrome [Polyangiaceae bacterium]|jgi:cytochrome c oxidase cbb3-type subunit 3/ubiquinol-cytochrome c reductase cytochrome c subunit